MPTTEKYLLGSQSIVLSTGSTLANNALAISSTQDNTAGAGGFDGYTLCDVQLNVTFGTAPTAGTGISVWFLRSQDGTTFEDGSASVIPVRPPDIVIGVDAVTTAQIKTRETRLSPGKFKVLAQNTGTGQTMSSGWTLSIRPITFQGV